MLWKIKREIKYMYDRLKYGVSDKDVWNLTDNIDSFIYEGLKRFKKVKDSYPAKYTEEEYKQIIDDMLEGYALIVQWKEYPFKGCKDLKVSIDFYTLEEVRKIKRAKKLWITHNLWD